MQAPIQEGFPTLRISAGSLQARGPFAQAQAAWLRPQPARVASLRALLAEKNAGVVSHFYMGPELQGVLTACDWPHIHISDSLAMADAAIAMARSGVKTVAVLGVDFMSENVRAMLDHAGHTDVEVVRVSAEPIGCSLAEAALAPAYGAWLNRAAQTPRSLHVIYINTSLLTKARAHAIVPTITCTSSNVVKTILQAYAQIPDLTVHYGPDTYMGRNLQSLFARYIELGDEAIATLHPDHNRATLSDALQRLQVFDQGTCIVHHMFGREVVAQVQRLYENAYFTAHLEVPGEMFALAVQAQRADEGVVGSTSNILSFINRKVAEDAAAKPGSVIQFVLGTEAGMITPIVRAVQSFLRSTGADIAVDIVFPVAAGAVAGTGDAALPVVPGVASGEGCSTAGGCATCPYMKMNDLDALMSVLRLADTAANPAANSVANLAENSIAAYRPRVYSEAVAGRTAADIGSEPILHMRDFQQRGRLAEALVRQVTAR
jgi:quinolinate synthase